MDLRCIYCGTPSPVLIEYHGDDICPRCRLEEATRAIVRDVPRFESWPTYAKPSSAARSEDDA